MKSPRLRQMKTLRQLVGAALDTSRGPGDCLGPESEYCCGYVHYLSLT
jgi:hypothetical protein